MKLKTIFLAFLLVAPTLVQARYYAMYCRGTAMADAYVAGGKPTFYIKMKNNHTRAGHKGKHLKGKTCAWKNRALRRDEPRELFFRKYPLTKQSMVLNCLSNPKCVIEVKATNYKEKWFVTPKNARTVFHYLD